MDINFFREFAVLARTGSYSEAAEQLFLSQPSLSKHIKSAELELGRPLFRRTTRRIELTPFGAALLPYAEQIAALQDEYTARLLHVPQEKAVISLGLGYPLPEKTIVYELAVGVCRAAGFEPNVVFTSPSCENIFYLIEKGSGVSIVRRSTSRRTITSASSRSCRPSAPPSASATGRTTSHPRRRCFWTISGSASRTHG